MTDRVLLVDDDPRLLDLLVFELSGEGLACRTAFNAAEARAALQREVPDVVVLDLVLPDVDGTQLLSELHAAHPALPVVVLTAEDDVGRLVECMRMGAADFVRKPFDRQRLLTSLRNALDRGELVRRVDQLTRELRRGKGFGRLLGRSPRLRECVATLRRAAACDAGVLISGEAGTGKEVAARALHAEGARGARPFVTLHCGALPEELLERELLGHEAGHGEDPGGPRPGVFEQADGGTLLLDEAGALGPDLQAALMDVLRRRAVRRVGSDRERPVDVRVVATTSRDLQAEVAAGRFRADLHEALGCFPVRMPPLREREGDVLALAEHFLQRHARRHGREIVGLSPDALDLLQRYPWPGNVRELECVLEHAVLLEGGGRLDVDALPATVRAGALRLPPAGSPPPRETAAGAGRARPAAPSGGPAPDRARHGGSKPGRGAGRANGNGHGPGTPDETADGDASPGEPATILTFEEEERRILLRALRLTGWRISEAAERLGLGRATIYRKIARYGLR